MSEHAEGPYLDFAFCTFSPSGMACRNSSVDIHTFEYISSIEYMIGLWELQMCFSLRRDSTSVEDLAMIPCATLTKSFVSVPMESFHH